MNRLWLSPGFVRLAAVAVSAALALISIEAALRFTGGRPVFDASVNVAREHFASIYEHDSRLGWVPRAHARSVLWNVPVTTGRDGIRQNGHPLDDTRMRSQVLALGDSFTFGDGVADADTWPAYLERLLDQRLPARRYQVLNAGASSYGLDQAILRAEDLIPRYRPELVILSFIEDDIERCREVVRHGQPKPYFVLTRGQLDRQNVPVPLPAANSDTREYLLRHSVLAGALAQRRLMRGLLTRHTEMD